MYKVLSLILTLLISQCVISQSFFEGDIIYKFALQKKDSSFDETTIATYPAKTTSGIFKNGNWLQRPDSGIIEYSYFNQTENRLYWKIRDSDTLLYELANEQRNSEIDSTIKTKIEYKTDTLLDLICNRLIIQTQNLKLTFVYHPSLTINPVWYQNTKQGYYDIIYGLTKSLYLRSIVETDSFISTMTVKNIVRRKVYDSEFPDISKHVLKKLE